MRNTPLYRDCVHDKKNFRITAIMIRKIARYCLYVWDNTPYLLLEFYRVFLNVISKLKEVITWLILIQKVYVNMCPKLWYVRDTRCQSFL